MAPGLRPAIDSPPTTPQITARRSYPRKPELRGRLGLVVSAGHLELFNNHTVEDDLAALRGGWWNQFLANSLSGLLTME